MAKSQNSSSPSPMASPSGSYSSSGAAPSSMAVSLALKRFRLAFAGAVVVGAVGVAMVLFEQGVTLHKVKLKTLEANAESQKKLLDQYNSYTGNAASAFIKPIESFITMALQLAMLRFAARSLLVPQTAWRVNMVVWLAAFALVYLLLNGFNALNVQLKAVDVQPVVKMSDLSSAAAMSSNGSTVAQESQSLESNATSIVPEWTVNNPVANTVLRTAVRSRVWTSTPTTCRSKNVSKYDIDSKASDFGVQYGFPIRSWLPNILPNAPTASTLRISLLNTTTDPAPTAEQLPMNVTTASSLLFDAFQHCNTMANWFGTTGDNFTSGFESKRPTMAAGVSYYASAARLAGLLPLEDPQDELKDREWFLRAAPEMIKARFAMAKSPTPSGRTNNDTESGVAIRFSHIDLADGFVFDAVTIDAEVNTYKYTDAVVDGARHMSWYEADQVCGPKPISICGVEKKRYFSQADGAAYDLASQVRGARVCLNSNGMEEKMVNYSLSSVGGRVSGYIDCENSNSSMLVISVGKRIVADSVLETGKYASSPVLVNARKIYSITVGRLAWKTEDLAETFNAACDADTESACKGFKFPLVSAGNTTEYIVASVDAVPIQSVGQENGLNVQSSPLVRLYEPPKYDEQQAMWQNVYDAVAGDMLLPHNLLINSTRVVEGDTCLPLMESRADNVLTNHLYMEEGLQPAYMSALFYLFQNGVVKQAVTTPNLVQTLNFDDNIHISALVASIPKTNAYLSLGGCVVLVLGLFFTVFYSGSQPLPDSTSTAHNNLGTQDAEKHPLATVSDPRVIAQVFLNEGRFPPMFLDRKVVDTSGQATGLDMATFHIASMTLSREDDVGTRVVLENDMPKAAPHGGIV